MLALVDCNNFYVSCERVFAPRLEGLPVGVMSNNDGCLIARSQELKEHGVAMGTPVHQLTPELRRRCVLLSSNYALYGAMSARVTAVLGQYTPVLEVYSIDESFLHFDGFPGGDALEERWTNQLLHQLRPGGVEEVKFRKGIEPLAPLDPTPQRLS